jgi:hypothetical protein
MGALHRTDTPKAPVTLRGAGNVPPAWTQVISCRPH